jgi:hypothetical protein
MTEGSPCLHGCEGQCAGRGACEPRVETESCNSSTDLIGKEFEIVQLSTSLVESSQHLRPAGLTLITVRELYVGVGQGIIGNGKLLESYNRNVPWSVWPGIIFLQNASDTLERSLSSQFEGSIKMLVRFVFRIIKDPLIVALDMDRKACIDQGFGIFW